MTTEKLIAQARAKIIWGESPDMVLAFLKTEGMGDQQSTALIELLANERKQIIQAHGKRNLIFGSALICVPIISYLTFHSVRIVPLKIFGTTVAIGAFGFWKASKGVFDLVRPDLQRGDLSDYE